MKKIKSIATAADLLLLAVLVIIFPLAPWQKAAAPPRIPDKLEIRYHTQPQGDTTLLRSQLDEIQYYLRVHNVADEGYNDVARFNTVLQHRLDALLHPTPPQRATRRMVNAKDRPLTAVRLGSGYWKAGRFCLGPLYGPAVCRDDEGRVVSAYWRADTIVTAIRRDSLGVYRGQMNRQLQASGQGTWDGNDGTHHEGFYATGQRHGFGFESSPHRQVRIGEWREDRFLGERMRYTSERIYGIDISRHQHEKGRRRYAINWSQLRITSLGQRHDAGGQTFPVSFVYIKSTEGTTVRNRYFMNDYLKARREGLKVGAYHFFSLKTPAEEQANYFVGHTLFRPGDFPPVLDVEPTDAQISQAGGDEELMRRIRTFMQTVEQRTKMRPILYVSQSFVNRHMLTAADIKQRYNVWIARYSQYKPDVRLAFWQLSADGRVSGITGPVDINVFNGYQTQWDDFVSTGFHQ